jgi:hypothetical protein
MVWINGEEAAMRRTILEQEGFAMRIAASYPLFPSSDSVILSPA